MFLAYFLAISKRLVKAFDLLEYVRRFSFNFKRTKSIAFRNHTYKVQEYFRRYLSLVFGQLLHLNFHIMLKLKTVFFLLNLTTKQHHEC